ncbi:MAG TPA: HEAT repeat domain-containing protein [Terriglobia bacterium]|nr:HEAT repeat domain-containing protein [Terriglobia bacterium]
MRRLPQLVILVVLALVFPTIGVVGQESKPAPAPAAPAPTPPAPPPTASPTSNNPNVMLLKQGHSEGVRSKAARDLGKEGDRSTIPALVAALSDPSPKVRREVVFALAQFHQPEVLPPLEQATKDVDDSVRITAVQCLVGYYSGVLPKSGFTGFVSKNWQRATSHFQADDSKIDPGIFVDPGVITALIAAMKDTRSNEAAREAAKGLGILLAKPAVIDLVAAAHSSDSDLAREALNSLTKIKDMTAGPKLLDLLDSPDKDVKRDACVTVGVLRTSEALPKLQSTFQNAPDQKDKVAAIQGLAYLGDRVSVPIFIKALWNEDKTIRTAAAEGLARAADPQSRSELEKAAMAEKDAGAKLAINFALAALGKEDALNDVVSELGGKIRGDIARSYLIELTRNPAFLPKLYPYLQSPDGAIRRRLCEVLMYSGDQGSLQQLDRLDHDSDNDVVAESLRAKRAIRTRLGAAAPAAKP